MTSCRQVFFFFSPSRLDFERRGAIMRLGVWRASGSYGIRACEPLFMPVRSRLVEGLREEES